MNICTHIEDVEDFIKKILSKGCVREINGNLLYPFPHFFHDLRNTEISISKNEKEMITKNKSNVLPSDLINEILDYIIYNDDKFRQFIVKILRMIKKYFVLHVKSDIQTVRANFSSINYFVIDILGDVCVDNDFCIYQKKMSVSQFISYRMSDWDWDSDMQQLIAVGIVANLSIKQLKKFLKKKQYNIIFTHLLLLGYIDKRTYRNFSWLFHNGVTDELSVKVSKILQTIPNLFNNELKL